MFMRLIADRIDVVPSGNYVTVGITLPEGHRVFLHGGLVRMRGVLPGTPSFVAVTPWRVTVEDAFGERLEIQFSSLEAWCEWGDEQ